MAAHAFGAAGHARDEFYSHFARASMDGGKAPAISACDGRDGTLGTVRHQRDHRGKAMSIGVAVIGAGHWGPNFIRNFDNPPVSDVVSVIDQDAARLSQVESRFPHVTVNRDVETVWVDPHVHAVIIATPTSTHYTLVKAALLAGKHVLVEKPITNSVAQAEELGRLAAAEGCVLMVGHVFLYNSAVQ